MLLRTIYSDYFSDFGPSISPSGHQSCHRMAALETKRFRAKQAPQQTNKHTHTKQSAHALCE
jgi:hypothetical protein